MILDESDLPPGVKLGVVQSSPGPLDIEGFEQAARYVEVQLVPTDDVIQARIANIGQSTTRGLFLPPQEGDEVLVLFPGNRENSAVVIGGLGNNRSPNPTNNDGTKALLMWPTIELRSDDALPVHGVVLAPLLGDLSGFVNALNTFMTAASSAATAPQIAAAAVTFLSSTGIVPPTPDSFAAQLAQAAVSDSPYASPSIKATE